MARKPSKVDYSTGEIVEEIESRVADRLDQIRRYRPSYFRASSIAPVSGDSMTHQSHAESCDINNIIRQFDRTGVLPVPTRTPQYADVSNLNRDLTELMEESVETRQRYGELLAKAQAEVDAAKNAPPPTDVPPTPVPPVPNP